MRTQVPPRHPLRQLFGALTERSFTEHLGWPDLNVTSYVSNLLVEFTHSDQLYKIRNQQGQPVDTVMDLGRARCRYAEAVKVQMNGNADALALRRVLEAARTNPTSHWPRCTCSRSGASCR